MRPPPVSARNCRASAALFVPLCIVLAAACGAAPQEASRPAPRAPDVRYEPSAVEVVDAMLQLAQVKPGDVVYDLGCGDGRIVIAAARRGARGVCVDIDPQRIAESRDNARQAGVADRIVFLNQDLFETDLREATVVTLFLSPEVNLALRPKLQRELAPGARVVSHWHAMGGWKPERTVAAESDGRERYIYLWRITAPGPR